MLSTVRPRWLISSQLIFKFYLRPRSTVSESDSPGIEMGAKTGFGFVFSSTTAHISSDGRFTEVAVTGTVGSLEVIQ